MKLHKGAFDGKDLYFVRTDASDRAFATAEKLVFVPKLATLTSVGLSGAVYLFDNGAAGQAPVFSNEPGGDGYTPAWTVHKVTWRGTPRRMSSVAEIEAAKSRGDVDVDKSNVVVNYSLVKWSTGSLPVDTEKKAYLGTGQLLEEPDTTGGRVTFKLSECYPGNRYFVVDHSMAPMAEGTFTGFAPGLPGRAQQGRRHRAHQRVHGTASKAPVPWGSSRRCSTSPPGTPRGVRTGTTSPTNGRKAQRPSCSPTSPRCSGRATPATSRSSPGVPDTKGTVFTVNCPVPVLAPNTFEPA